MDKLAQYRQIIKQILTEYVELSQKSPNPELENFLITDEANGQTNSQWAMSNLQLQSVRPLRWLKTAKLKKHAGTWTPHNRVA